MNFKNQLITIISILLIKLSMVLISLFSIQFYDIGGEIFYVLSILLEIATLFFLYWMVVNHFGGSIHLILIIIISLVSMYNLVGHFYNFVGEASLEQSLNDEYIQQFLIKGLPGLLSLTCNIILAYQLLKNDVKNINTQNNLRLVGKSYFVRLAALFAVPALSVFFEAVSWLNKAAAIIYMLPIILMFKLYWEELEQLKAANKV